MTTQACIAAQSVGTSTNFGNGILSINPLTIGGTTTAYVVNVQLANGAGPVDPNQMITIRYTTTMRTVTAANAPVQLAQTQHTITIRPSPNASVTQIVDSALEPVTGSKFHLWADVPAYPLAGTLTVDLVELP